MLFHLRFADDILITDNLGEIRTIITELVACKKVGLNINFGKTQFMTNLILSENLKIGSNEIILLVHASDRRCQKNH